MVINCGKKATQQPSGGVAHSNGNEFVVDTGHTEKIDLPEYHKGRNHDKHRCTAVTCTAQSTGVNLIEAAKKIERRDIMQK